MSTAGSTTRSAKDYRESEASFAGFLVLAVHVFRRLSQCLDRRVEIYTMPRRNLVAGDRICCPCFYGAECASLDTRNLHIASDRIAGHAQVMLESRFRGILDYQRFSIESGGNQSRRHRRRYADLGLTPTFSR